MDRLALAAVGIAVRVALQYGLRPFGGATRVNVVRALNVCSSVRACIDATGLMRYCRGWADGQTTDQNSGERGGDGVFGKFHGVSPELSKR